MGIGPVSSGWKPDIITIILYPLADPLASAYAGGETRTPTGFPTSS